MPTTRQLIRGALRLLGAVASGENMEANETLDALTALNGLLSSWSLERLLVYHVSRLPLPLVAGQRVYTWGPGGDIPGSRPLRLEQALLNLGPSGGTGGDLEWPVRLLSQQEYEGGVWLKDLDSTYVLQVYLEPSFPLAHLHVWPVATDSTTTLIVFPWVPLEAVSSLDLDVELTFPPGYERMLRAGLACELAAEYGREPPQIVVAMLLEAKSSVKRLNVVVPLMWQPIHGASAPPASLGASRYDIRSDGVG